MLIIFSELKPKKGIPYCRDHLRRLWKEGKFPKPVDVGPGRLAWIESEVDAHIEAIVAKRDMPMPPAGKTEPETRSAKPSPAMASRSVAPRRRESSTTRPKRSSGARRRS